MRAGVIGLGFIGMIHLEALMRIPGIEVVAISDLDKEKVSRIAKEYNIPGIFDDWKSLLKSDNIDVIHNCTPNYLHYEINKEALKKGKNIFSEKPLAMDVEQTKELLKLSGDGSILTGVNYCYRFYPAVLWMKQLIKEGFIGSIRTISGFYKQDWLMFPGDYNWRVEADLGGQSRVLADIGQHWCDLSEFVTDLRIEKVFSDYQTVIKNRKKPLDSSIETFSQTEKGYREIKIDTEDQATTLLRFSGGVRGNFTVSQINAGHKNDLEIEISGSLKTLKWSQQEPDLIWVGERGGKNHILYKDPEKMPDSIKKYVNYPAGHPEGYGDIIKNTILSYYQAVEKNKEGICPTFVDGHRCMRIIDAILNSGKRDDWVTISAS